MGDSLSRMPLNHRAKCDAASFILAEEIRNHTKLETKLETVNDIIIHTLPIGMCG